MEWDFDYLTYGGAGGGSVNAVGITRARQELTDMVHFVHDNAGWRLERHYPAGGSSVVVASRTYAAAVFSGTCRLTLNRETGIITVLGADGVSTDHDWNAAISGSPLSNYQSSAFVEIIAPSDPLRVMRYLRVKALP